MYTCPIFFQFSKIVLLYNTDCVFMFLLSYRNIVFLKLKHDHVIMYAHNFFSYFEYDDFLT